MKLSLCLVLITFTLCGQWSYLGQAGLSQGNTRYISTAVNPITNEPYVAFMDWWQLSVKKWNGSEWTFVGKQYLSEGPVNMSSMDFDSQGACYVAYTDGLADNGPTVRRFNGTEWEVLGKRGITGAAANFVSLDVDASDNVFIAFRESAEHNPGNIRSVASVMKFNGTGWEFVGKRRFTDTGQAYPALMDLSLRVDSKGTPYVAYNDWSKDENFKQTSKSTTVKRFNGTSWENVGEPGFAIWCVMYSRAIAIDSKDRPYLLCRNKQGTTTAMRFEEGKWNEFGTPCPIIWGSEWGNIEIVNDIPYIAMQDYSCKRHLSVIRCVNGKWEFVGKQNISPGSVLDVALAVDSDENIYTAFADSAAYLWKLSVMKYTNPVASLKESKGNNSLRIFPNPSGSIFYIDGQLRSVTIRDAHGKALFTTSANMVDLSSYPRGVYFFELNTNGSNRTEKVVLQ